MAIQILPDPLSLLRPVSKIVTASYTRPADTTAYTAGDVLADSTSSATILTFANVARANGLGFLVDGVTVAYSGAPATKPDLELWLFDTSITMQQDNAIFNPADADVAKCLGVVPLSGSGAIIASPLANSGNMVQHIATIVKSRAAAAATTSIFGVVVVRSAYTPTSAESFTFRLHVIQD
jgi:hypothetical protein